jgi:hypothetical protein
VEERNGGVHGALSGSWVDLPRRGCAGEMRLAMGKAIKWIAIGFGSAYRRLR